MLRRTVTSFAVVPALSLLLLAAACSWDSPAEEAQATQVNVVTTSNIVADWVT